MLTDNYDTGLVVAVMNVFDSWNEEQRKPSSDKWLIHTRKYRPEMIDTVITKWSKNTGIEPEEFPYHDDFVAYVWIGYRKLEDRKKDELRDHIAAL